jgi:aminoglycoside 6'-N-acetyltransferase
MARLCRYLYERRKSFINGFARIKGGRKNLGCTFRWKGGIGNFQSCCIREVYEETGYTVTIIKEIYRKNNAVVEVHYFETVVIGGQMTIHDPDELIYDIAWQSKDDVARLALTFPEDRSFLLSLFP